MGYFPVRYDSRVVIYKRKVFIRLATVVQKIAHNFKCMGRGIGLDFWIIWQSAHMKALAAAVAHTLFVFSPPE